MPRWELLTEHAAFSPRDTAEGVIFRDRMWISNAYYHGNQLTRDLWRSENGVAWEQVSDATPYDGYSQLVVYEDRLYAVKGSVWVSADGEHWECILAKTPFRQLGYNEVLVFQGRMWQIGPGPEVWHSADGVEWTCATASAPFGDRAAGGIALHDGRLWLVAGRTVETNDPPESGYPDYTTHNDVWCSEDGCRWTRVVEHGPFAPRMWCVSRSYAGRLWLVGGYDNVNERNFGDVWHSEDGTTWTELVADPVFAPRHEPTLYVHRGSLWVVAGNTWPVVNDVWRLTID
jgi:hypothetical protein